MRDIITWLYAKFVLNPALRKLRHPARQWDYLMKHDIALIEDIEVLRAMVEYDRGDFKSNLRVV